MFPIPYYTEKSCWLQSGWMDHYHLYISTLPSGTYWTWVRWSPNARRRNGSRGGHFGLVFPILRYPSPTGERHMMEVFNYVGNRFPPVKVTWPSSSYLLCMENVMMSPRLGFDVPSVDSHGKTRWVVRISFYWGCGRRRKLDSEMIAAAEGTNHVWYAMCTRSVTFWLAGTCVCTKTGNYVNMEQFLVSRWEKNEFEQRNN